MVKTRKFSDPVYLGDPINALRIFNEKEVDELIIIDISATRQGRRPDLSFVEELAGECFMPLCYGGGIDTVSAARAVLRAGCEKVAMNSALRSDPTLARRLTDEFGRQSLVASVDVVVQRRRGYRVAMGTGHGAKRLDIDPVQLVRELDAEGVGEILLTSVDRDGSASGYDLDLIRLIAGEVGVPVIVCGGAASIDDFREGLGAGASAVAAGRMFVTHGRHFASLVSYVSSEEIESLASTGFQRSRGFRD